MQIEKIFFTKFDMKHVLTIAADRVVTVSSGPVRATRKYSS